MMNPPWGRGGCPSLFVPCGCWQSLRFAAIDVPVLKFQPFEYAKLDLCGYTGLSVCFTSYLTPISLLIYLHLTGTSVIHESQMTGILKPYTYNCIRRKKNICICKSRKISRVFRGVILYYNVRTYRTCHMRETIVFTNVVRKKFGSSWLV